MSDPIFIDANIFIYYVTEHPQFVDSCEDLIQRMEKRKIIGITSIFVLNEVLHKMMILEVCKKYNKTMGQAIGYLKRSPEAISRLSSSKSNIEEIMNIGGLQIVEVPSHLFEKAVEISWKYGLLTTDAFHVATMKQYGIKNIATFDKDFERVEFVNVVEL
ncbi:MAG: PIN domain-containing protein [Methanomicrobia archaeon]|nr:PIN domain-containing protein [Methanomicrobia archaeon]